MTKKVINQKGKFNEELLNTIEPNFVFQDKPINRFNIIKNSDNFNQANKAELLDELKKQINSIENCNLKDNAQKNKEIRLLGVEVYLSGIGSVLSKINEYNLCNVRVVSADAEELLQTKIPNSSLDAVIMFYPDPWPKRKHHKRRLIKEEFLELLNKKLKINGIFYFKTDWKDYFDDVSDLLIEDPSWIEVDYKALDDHLRDIPSTSFEKKAKQSNRALNTKILKKIK